MFIETNLRLRHADLDARAAQYLPAFAQNKKGHVTIRQLLTHTAGLREFYPFYNMGLTQKEQVRHLLLGSSYSS
jgi:CubicO group peptidase (beta-lactamase class C family)